MDSIISLKSLQYFLQLAETMRIPVPTLDTPVKQKINRTNLFNEIKLPHPHYLLSSVMPMPQVPPLNQLPNLILKPIDEMYDNIYDQHTHYLVRLLSIITRLNLNMKMANCLELVDCLCEYNAFAVKNQSSDIYSKCIHMLTLGQIEESCNLLLNHQNYHLAVAISSAFNASVVVQELNSNIYSNTSNDPLTFLQSLTVGDTWFEPLDLNWSQVFILKYYFYFGPSSTIKQVLSSVLNNFEEDRYQFQNFIQISDPLYYLVKWFADPNIDDINQCISLVESGFTEYPSLSFIIKKELRYNYDREIRHLLDVLLSNKKCSIAMELCKSLGVYDLAKIVLLGIEEMEWDTKWGFEYALSLGNQQIDDNIFVYLLHNIVERHDDLMRYFRFIKKKYIQIPDDVIKEYIKRLIETHLLYDKIVGFVDEFDDCLNEDFLEILQKLNDNYEYLIEDGYSKMMNGSIHEDIMSTASIEKTMLLDEWRVES